MADCATDATTGDATCTCKADHIIVANGVAGVNCGMYYIFYFILFVHRASGTGLRLTKYTEAETSSNILL